MNERLLLVGDMARDDALASYLQPGVVLNIASGHIHPGLKPKAEHSGGHFESMDITNGQLVSDFAASCNATLAIVTGDKPLAAGVVDYLTSTNPGLLIAAPNSHSFLPESDKEDTRLRNVDIGMPELNPFYLSAHNDIEVDEMVREFKSRHKSLVVKPRGPAGGRGVQVMGKPGHFQTYDDGAAYAKTILEDPNQPGVLLEEELVGPEFNLQIYTDGLEVIAAPVTIDFPYRFDGDIGPGTGGMGSINFAFSQLPPFLRSEDYDYCMSYCRRFLARMSADGKDMKGVFYPNFKLTIDGIKSIENNLRRGDPEWMNIEATTDPNVDRVQVNRHIATHELRSNDVWFRDIASTVIYFAAHNYAERGASFKRSNFELNSDILSFYGVKAYFSSCRQVGPNQYETISTSRAIALEAEGATPSEAQAKILAAKAAGGIIGELDNRTDPGSQEYLDMYMQDPRVI